MALRLRLSQTITITRYVWVRCPIQIFISSRPNHTHKRTSKADDTHPKTLKLIQSITPGNPAKPKTKIQKRKKKKKHHNRFPRYLTYNVTDIETLFQKAALISSTLMPGVLPRQMARSVSSFTS